MNSFIFIIFLCGTFLKMMSSLWGLRENFQKLFGIFSSVVDGVGYGSLMVTNLETGSFARIRIFSLLTGTFFKAMSASLCLMGINDFQGISFF